MVFLISGIVGGGSGSNMRLRIAGLLIMLPLFVIASCTEPRDVMSGSACSGPLGPCIVRDVEAMRPDDPDDLLQAFIVMGAVGDLTRWTSETQQRYPGFALPVMEEFRGLSAEQALAAATLAAAAFNSADPYADPEWLAVVGDMRDDPKVSQHAVSLIRNLGYDPWEYILRDPPGHAAIWRMIVAKTPNDNERLLELANDLSFYGPSSLKPLARQLIDRFVGSPNPTPSQQARAADMLADRFNDADAAQALMNAGGNKATDYDLSAINAGIAAARLWNGANDPTSARTVGTHLISNGPGLGNRPFRALLRAKAFLELRRVGDAYLQQARGTGVDAFEAVQLFAAASDCYRLANDREAAIVAAREGMPLIPQAFGGRSHIPELGERRRMAGEDNGMTVAPAIALYRAGAEEEAMQSNFVAGLELLKYWDRPLADFDPQWIVDDAPKWLDVSISEIARRKDPPFAARVHDALARTSGAAEPNQLAILSAVAGNTEQVRAHLEEGRAVAEANAGHPSDRPFLLLRTAMAWKVTEMLAATQ